MTAQSILTSAWVWLAFAFVVAMLLLCVWALMRSAGLQSREEEVAEAARFRTWREHQKEQETLARLRAEMCARRKRGVVDPRERL